ncbi:uncharacterized protein PFL1_00257 [Pseudozyma flocculosa PF-1]|uniref:Related to Aquaporin 3 n=1 Tax=Pseudozyma flocculosa TaxID=84751 RepID=A0A5C3ESK0_9BASI|nr:uncharacterized protein PFL1_00257 [Pseudozyma flocculosa PF-1]EPQ32059.1 hypothetical protein PFL1_00257 [Pseudozyma flocculosa PF-1]SPO35012.1 related to Aquaporin 3 [Pseudozyma flocculosa]
MPDVEEPPLRPEDAVHLLPLEVGPRTYVDIFRAAIREEVAEFLGTAMILLFGAGVQCQVQLYGAGNYATCCLGWAAGVAVGAYIAGPTSGGHINPAVTISLALFRRFPKNKVPKYILAQVLGAMFGACTIYFIYRDTIVILDPNSTSPLFGSNSAAGSFVTHPASSISGFTAWVCEFGATAILVGAIFALTDARNPTGFSVPLGLFILILGIGASFGAQTGYAINPARDFGPRIALTLLGYGGEIWTHDAVYWLRVPWFACLSGGVFGGFVYDFLLNTTDQTVFNNPHIELA